MKLHVLLATTLFACISIAHAQHKHVHGEGRLEAVLDKETLTLSLELPLDAAVGFERAPKNDKEKAMLASAEKILNNPALFQPATAAQCVVQSIQVSMPAFTGDHADIDATHIFHCTKPAALSSVETTLFKSLQRLYRLEAQRVGPAGQGAQRLTPNKPVLNW